MSCLRRVQGGAPLHSWCETVDDDAEVILDWQDVEVLLPTPTAVKDEMALKR